MLRQRGFIILALTAVWLFAIAERLWPLNGSSHNSSAEAVQRRPSPTPKRAEARAEVYGPPIELGKLQDAAINESSGIVASRGNPGLFWTHNDSGDGPFIYAIDRQGKSRGVWRVTGAAARDWEDIAAGPGPESSRTYIYVGDIGDNDRKRASVDVYRFVEPVITDSNDKSSKSKPNLTETATAIHLSYPDGSHDAETLLVHPKSGNIYIITKIFMGKAGVYKAKAPVNTAGTIALEFVGPLNIPGVMGGFVTGGDISPDGQRVAICDYTQGYEFVVGAGKDFDDVWKQPPQTIVLGTRKQGEAIAYRLDGKALLTTSEGLHSPLIEIVRR